MSRAFIAYSSIRHVSYIDEVLNTIESILESLDIKRIYLGDGFSGIRYYHEMLLQNITESDFGIVILDGLRPNVTYELGLLQMSKIKVIPLIKNDAKFSVKSIYFNLHKKYNDPEIAFGNYRYRKSAFNNLIEPDIIMREHFSDCEGMDEVRYATIDDTQENGSLGKVLREEITKIIPYLRSRTGPGFPQLHLMFPEIESNLLDESIQLLSLFSVIGWHQNYVGDTTFQSIRKDFLSLFINQSVSVDQLNNIFNLLLESKKNILKNYGRYLTIDSEKLIHDSFEFFMQNTAIFNTYYVKIMNSPQTELKRRFIERISSSDILGNESKEAIANYIFDRLGIFKDISTIQNKESCQFFVNSASINPSKALDLLYEWISPLTPMQMAQQFSFESTLISPGNSHDDVLWFLNNVSKNDLYFNQSMQILLKFSLPIIVEEEQIQTQIHPYIHKLALDRFLEQCHSLEGEVSVINRWDFIQNLSWLENWPEDYIMATKDLKFRAIKTFLQNSWTIPGPIREGNLKINRYSIADNISYDELESCRTKAYQTIMDWLEKKEEYEFIYDNLFDYYYYNLSEWLRYTTWDKIKSLYERIFKLNPEKVLIFLTHIDKLQAYDTWQQTFSDDDLKNVFQFQKALEDSLSIKDNFRRKLDFSIHDLRVNRRFSEEESQVFISQIQLDLLDKYNSLSVSERDEIIKLLISENFSQSFDFGIFFADNLQVEELKDLITLTLEIIGKFSDNFLSNFYIGLWTSLFNSNEMEWEYLLNENWTNTNIQLYLKKIIWPTRNRISEFIWNKNLNLLKAGLIEPLEFLFIFHKELPSSISYEEIKSNLIKCIEIISESNQTENKYPIELYTRFIWRLERIFQEKEELLDEEIAVSFLENFQPISKEILSQLHDTNIILQFGRLANEKFETWLKTGFQISEFEGDHFLIRCIDDFTEQIFHITEKLFLVSQDSEELTGYNYISYSFEIGGESGILLRFSEKQVDILYKLNSQKLGYLFGRLIRNSPIEDPFPPMLRRLIILHYDDLEFKNRIFQAFSTGVRSFVGNNYDQQYSGDYARIAQWRETATDKVFRLWLKELHQHIDLLKNRNGDFWKEREVE